MASILPIRCSFGRSSARALTALGLLLGLCVAGEPVTKTEQDETAWGEAVRSLQAGVRILPDEDDKPHAGPYCFGDEIRLEFRLRNVGERMIKIEEFRPFPLRMLLDERTICCFYDDIPFERQALTAGLSRVRRSTFEPVSQ